MEGGCRPTGINGLRKVKFCWGFIVDSTVWTNRIVSFLELVDASPGFQLIDKPFTVQTIGSESAMKTFNIRILPGSVRFNVECPNALFQKPILNLFGHQFRSIIASDTPKGSVSSDRLAFKLIQYRLYSSTMLRILMDRPSSVTS